MPDTHNSFTGPAFRILVIVSRPLDLNELPNIADQWALINGLATVKAPVEIQILHPPTIERLRAEVLNGYDIVHFDGHGSFSVACPNCSELNAPGSSKCKKCSASLKGIKAGGYLAFEQDDGRQEALAAVDLAEMLRDVPGSPTKLVILSACQSAQGGDESLTTTLLSCGVPAVLGMKETVPVDVTIALSRALYAALGSGMTIEDAFKKFALPALKKLPDHPETGTKAVDIPILEGRGIKDRIITSPAKGPLTMEMDRLFGVPEFDFVGEFIPYNPPRGRKGLLYQVISALLAGEKLVVLTGQGGIGKSVLAAAAARRMAWRYPGGVFWRSGADKELGLNELLDAFANVFGYEFRTQPLDAKRDAVLSYMGDMKTPCLLVVDNAEVVKDQALWRFLEGLPKPSAAIVTTREALSREGTQISLVQMEPLEAFKLFVQEARRRSSGWGEKLNDAEKEALGEITHLLDGHPLGIKLAAGLLPGDTLDDIRQRLRARPPGEEINTRFDFSYSTLNESQRELLHRMAAFAGSAAVWTIEAIASGQIFEGDEAEPLEHWRDDLSDLVRKSFVDVADIKLSDDAGKEVTMKRRRLHPLMRQYAASKAGEAAMQVHHKREAQLFQVYAERFRGRYDALERERGNILAGADWAYAAGEWGLVKNFAWAMGSYLGTRGYWKDKRILLENAIKATYEQGDKDGVSRSLGELGNLAQETGDYQEARRLYQESLKIGQKLGDKSGISASLHNLGALAQKTGDYDEARRLYQESLTAKQELGDKSGASKSLHQLGMLAQATGDYDEARRLYKESLKIDQELGDKSGVSRSLHQLGVLAQKTSDYDEARRLDKESLNTFQDLGDKNDVSGSLHQLGILAQDAGDYDEARRLYKESLMTKLDLGDMNGIAIILAQSSLLEEIVGNHDKALVLIKLAERRFLELGSPMAAQAKGVRERLEKKR